MGNAKFESKNVACYTAEQGPFMKVRENTWTIAVWNIKHNQD